MCGTSWPPPSTGGAKVQPRAHYHSRGRCWHRWPIHVHLSHGISRRLPAGADTRPKDETYPKPISRLSSLSPKFQIPTSCSSSTDDGESKVKVYHLQLALSAATELKYADCPLPTFSASQDEVLATQWGNNCHLSSSNRVWDALSRIKHLIFVSCNAGGTDAAHLGHFRSRGPIHGQDSLAAAHIRSGVYSPPSALETLWAGTLRAALQIIDWCLPGGIDVSRILHKPSAGPIWSPAVNWSWYLDDEMVEYCKTVNSTVFKPLFIVQC